MQALQRWPGYAIRRWSKPPPQSQSRREIEDANHEGAVGVPENKYPLHVSINERVAAVDFYFSATDFTEDLFQRRTILKLASLAWPSSWGSKSLGRPIYFLPF